MKLAFTAHGAKKAIGHGYISVWHLNDVELKPVLHQVVELLKFPLMMILFVPVMFFGIWILMVPIGGIPITMLAIAFVVAINKSLANPPGA